MLTKSGPIETFDDTCGSVLDQTYANDNGGQDNQQKEINLLNEANLPSSSQKRLPFHIFTLDDKEPVEKWQMPFIYNEITIFNVQVFNCLKLFLVIFFQVMDLSSRKYKMFSSTQPYKSFNCCYQFSY